MQVLTERITALITVIQSFAFFRRLIQIPLWYYPLFLSIFECLSQTSYLHVFAPGAQGICDPSEGKKKKGSLLSWSAYCKRKKGSIARCSSQRPCVWMGPYLGLHTQGGEVCGFLWWETSVCDMGVCQGWGRIKWASLHLLRYAAPQCLLCLLESPRVVCAVTVNRAVYTVRHHDRKRLSTLMVRVFRMLCQQGWTGVSNFLSVCLTGRLIIKILKL